MATAGRSLLFGGDDGKLHALGERDGQPRLLWSLSLGRRVGEPILADIDGDGRPEILVPPKTGTVLPERELKTLAWVLRQTGHSSLAGLDQHAGRRLLIRGLVAALNCGG